jgi:hypothetical protein
VLPVAVRYRVIVRCTGNATSTLAGGGGTKLFCSQAVSVTSVDMARSAREVVCALHLVPAKNSEIDVGQAGFIQMPRLMVFSEKMAGKELLPCFLE